MIDPEVIIGLKERYSYLHPLLIHRSIERAKSAVDLFDILESVPKDVPLIWDEDTRRWVKTVDLFQSNDFHAKKRIGKKA